MNRLKRLMLLALLQPCALSHSDEKRPLGVFRWPFFQKKKEKPQQQEQQQQKDWWSAGRQKMGNNGNVFLVVFGTIASAFAVSARQTVTNVIDRVRRAIERSLWVVVEVVDTDDPKLFQQLVRYLHERDVLRSRAFRAISKTTEAAQQQQAPQQRGRGPQPPTILTGTPGLLKGDDVELMPLTSKGVSAYFRFKNRSVWCRLDSTGPNDTSGGEIFAAGRTRGRGRGDGGPTKLTFATFKTTTDERKMSRLISDLMRDAIKEAEEKDRMFVKVYEFAANSNPPRWDLASRARKRPPSTVVLKRGLVEDVLDDLSKFVKDEDWYVRRCLPHRRGYLLYGPPGNGKSSLVLAVASHFGWPLCVLSLARLHDTPLGDAVATAPPSSVVVLEDIDAAFNVGPLRRSADDMGLTPPEEPPTTTAATTANGAANTTTTRRGGRGSRGGFAQQQQQPAADASASSSLHELLNALDGLASQDGRIIFLTTNRKEALDPALVRPGRCDRTFYLGLADDDMAERLFLTFFKDPIDADDTDTNGHALLVKKLLAKEDRHLDSCGEPLDIDAMAVQYGKAVGGEKFSMATLQGHLLLHKTDPRAAIATAERRELTAPDLAL